MMLVELLQKVRYTQIFYVYLENVYDQNLTIGSGTRRDLLDEYENEEIISYLTCPVTLITTTKNGALVVRVRDEHFDERLEKQFNPEYAQKWNNLCMSSRPFKHSCEMEDFLDSRAADEQMQENAELKRLLKLAVEDIKTMLTCECVSKICAEQACGCTTIGQCRSICKWKHADEVMKLIGSESECD